MKNRINHLLLEEGFLPFEKMSYEEYLPFQKKIRCSDLTYVLLFCYDEFYPYFVKRMGNCLVLVWVDHRIRVFCTLIPLKEEELASVYEETAALFLHLEIPMSFTTMEEKYAGMLERHPLTESIGFQEERSDYLYAIEDYLNLEGGRNSHKRRDLNKIRKEYDNVSVEVIRDFRKEKKTLMKVMGQWCEEHDCEKCVYGCEKKILEKLLDSDLTKRLYGAIMYLGGRPEMFAISQIIGDTCYLYFKKSAGRIQGAFYYFEYAFLQNIRNVTYVNFEEDMGLPGLREYKRRRHPIEMIRKYDIRIKDSRESGQNR